MSKLTALLLGLAAIILGVLLLETAYRVIQLTKPVKQVSGNDRVIFADGGGTIFQNRDDIFTYIPHNEVRYVTAFFSGAGFETEYDYRIRTNNFGLVQDNDIEPERKSLLLLGDSFTEGLGASPWFRLLAPEVEKLGYQPVNGGLLGTGFEQWLKLDRYLKRADIDVEKVMVLFISNDFIRPVWNFTPNNLSCLVSLSECRIDRAVLYRLPPEKELDRWMDKIRQSREETSPLEADFAYFLPATHHVYQFLRQKLGHSEMKERLEEGQQESQAAIRQLIASHGGKNVAFVHLPQKDEIDRPSSLGLEARRAITDAGGKLFDGFRLCRLTARDYFPNDDHPNQAGYGKIEACVSDIAKTLAEVGQ